jgi:hypothetical protein
MTERLPERFDSRIGRCRPILLRDLTTDADEPAIVRSTISLGHDLGLSSLAAWSTHNR